MELLSRFAAVISALPESGPDEHALQQLLLAQSSPLSVYYAPFEWLNESARLVIVGITPGRRSMVRSLMASRAALRAGLSLEEAGKRGKQMGSFSNMRRNLASRLDALGVHSALGIPSTTELFAARSDLLHNTSAVRFPVLKGGENYSGYSPRPARSAFLRRFIDEYLAPEVHHFPQALFVPNGPAVAEALLAAGLAAERCLIGFPHASNGPGAKDRAATFEREREQMTQKVRAWAIRSNHSLPAG